MYSIFGRFLGPDSHRLTTKKIRTLIGNLCRWIFLGNGSEKTKSAPQIGSWLLRIIKRSDNTLTSIHICISSLSNI